MITISRDGVDSNIESFVFPGGEVQVSIPDLKSTSYYRITARIKNTHDIIELVMIDEILKRNDCKYNLVIPYLPYSRQDRVMKYNEAFSLKPVAKILNSLSYRYIRTLDCHSPVSNALFDNLLESTQIDVIHWFESELISYLKDAIIVAPDAGASKKSFNIANYLGLPMVVAEKIRCTKTGDILRTKINTEGYGYGYNETAFIFDDICDGGRTFIELAKVLRKQGFNKIYLYVTHGIFSKGLDVFDGLIDHIFTTNSFNEQPEHKILTTFNISDIL